MTYFHLRKHAPESEPEEDEPAEGDASEEAAPENAAGALWAGVSGPGRWLTARGRPGLSWLLYAGSAWAAGFYGGWTAVGLIAAWLLLVLLFLPPDFKDRLTAALERLDTPRPKRSPEPAVDPVVPLLWHLIGDAPGVHLKALTAHLQAAAPEQALDKDAVRAHLTALRITVKPSVRDATGRVNDGVHGADLKAWEQALPSTAPGPLPETPSGAVATALTSNVGTRRKRVATLLPALLRVLPRGVR
ncbi:hypothetical protein [Streptomyces prunicolor]